MSRILSIALFAGAAAIIVPTTAVYAQDSESCQKSPNCQSFEYQVIGVDIPLIGTDVNKTTCQEANSKNREISIQVRCNCDIPFLNNLPLISHMFGTASTEERESFLFEANNDPCCGTSEDCCKCCDQCNNACCGDQQNEVKVEVTCDGQPPLLSNVPYVSRLFKNVGLPSTRARECQASECLATNDRTTCAPATGCGNLTCETSACRADALLQLVSHHEASIEETGPTRDEMMHELMEMHVENARLEARVEAMEHHMELMEEMHEVRLENAALKAKLRLMEKHSAQNTSINHWHQPAGDAHLPYAVIGVAHPSHAAYSPQGNRTIMQPIDSTVSCPPVPQFVKQPTAHAAIFASGTPAPAEIQLVAEHARALQKELEHRHCECLKQESGCQKTSSK